MEIILFQKPWGCSGGHHLWCSWCPRNLCEVALYWITCWVVTWSCAYFYVYTIVKTSKNAVAQYLYLRFVSRMSGPFSDKLMMWRFQLGVPSSMSLLVDYSFEVKNEKIIYWWLYFLEICSLHVFSHLLSFLEFSCLCSTLLWEEIEMAPCFHVCLYNMYSAVTERDLRYHTFHAEFKNITWVVSATM